MARNKQTNNRDRNQRNGYLLKARKENGKGSRFRRNNPPRIPQHQSQPAGDRHRKSQMSRNMWKKDLQNPETSDRKADPQHLRGLLIRAKGLKIGLPLTGHRQLTELRTVNCLKLRKSQVRLKPDRKMILQKLEHD